MHKVLIISLSFALLAGCASREIPGQTMADPVLKRDIYQNIRTYELATTGDYNPKVLDTTHEDRADGSSREVWTVKSGQTVSKYEVLVRPSPQGGSDMAFRKIEGPMGRTK